MKSLSSMRNERFNTSRCRTSFKKWGCCTHTPPRSLSPYYMQGSRKNIKKKVQKIFFKCQILQVGGAGCSLYRLCPTAAWPSFGCSAGGCRDQRSWNSPMWVPHFCLAASLFLFFFFPYFWALWSIPPHWLQHMPALPKLLLKTWNIHNVWSVGPKIMKFILPQSLLRDTCLQKNSKNLKIKCVQVTLPKIGLVTPGTFNPLRVNKH
jgi:hypothetical protein